MRNLDWRIVSAAGQVLQTPLPGAGAPNPYCAGFKRHDVNPVSGGPVGKTEDEQSVASYVTFGKLRILYLGDFTWNQEFDLMCPGNRIGTVDLFVASRHGQPSSNSEALVHALRPRVTIVNNGSRKGGQPAAMNILLNSPRLENLWQMHFALLGGQEYAVPGTFIANLEESATVPIAPLPAPQRGTPAPPVPQHEGMAHWIKVSAQTDGRFTVTNSRNGFSKTYTRTLEPTLRQRIGHEMRTAPLGFAACSETVRRHRGRARPLPRPSLDRPLTAAGARRALADRSSSLMSASAISVSRRSARSSSSSVSCNSRASSFRLSRRA